MGAAQAGARSPRRRPQGLATVLLLAAAVAFMLLAGGPGDLLALPQLADTLANGATPQSMPTAGGGTTQLESAGVAPRRIAAEGQSMLELLSTCTTFECLREAHAMPRPAGALFNYPHAIILGYPKCATTSIAAWLDQHPQAAASTPKEPEFFSFYGKCTHPKHPWRCNPTAERRYILHTMQRDAAVQSGLQQAMFEASTGYSWGEHSTPQALAAGIRQELPWLRLVLTIREPISQTISGRAHLMDLLVKKMKQKMPPWYKRRGHVEDPEDAACLRRAHRGAGSIYECVQPRMAGGSAYGNSLAAWMEHWPRDQLHIIQFENMTAPATHDAVLGDLQRFLGLDPSLAPAELPLANSRKARFEGWPMKRAEYEELVGYARAQADEVAALLEANGFYTANEWLAAWEEAWRSNLDRCDENGDCKIQVT